MGFFDRIISDGIRQGVSSAIGEAVKQAVEPKATEAANMMANELDQAAASLALETAKNTKICPKCQNPASADKQFCPLCGTKLPEETLAQGALCPNCGKQNALGTKFCQACGTKLPFAVAEDNAAAEQDAAALQKWAEVLPEFPVWNLGGRHFDLEVEDGYVRFNLEMESDAIAAKAISDYREVLKQNGFKEAGMNPCREHLYKKVGEKCCHVDTEHCFEGNMDSPDLYFNYEEPYGGYDYVKPEPKSGFSFKDLFK